MKRETLIPPFPSPCPSHLPGIHFLGISHSVLLQADDHMLPLAWCKSGDSPSYLLGVAGDTILMCRWHPLFLVLPSLLTADHYLSLSLRSLFCVLLPGRRCSSETLVIEMSQCTGLQGFGGVLWHDFVRAIKTSSRQDSVSFWRPETWDWVSSDRTKLQSCSALQSLFATAHAPGCAIQLWNRGLSDGWDRRENVGWCKSLLEVIPNHRATYRLRFGHLRHPCAV